MTAPLVDIADLVIGYDTGMRQVRALDGASLRIDEDETLAIVGESGSGKTTLGMAAGRLLPPEAKVIGGSIHVAGVDVTRADDEALRRLRHDKLGFVFQNPTTALDPTLRIGRQVALAMGGRPPPEAIAELLSRAELNESERILRAFPHELSGGMAQRVVIAMAIARRPHLLIADEPTASLDASIREKVMSTLGRLRAESGASLVILSHDLRMVARHADRVAVMYGGRIVELGSVTRVMQAPAHPYTRALLTAAAGNERPGERLCPIPGTPPILESRCEACAYADRCAFRETRCDTERPEARPFLGREVVCHRAEAVIGAPTQARQEDR
ncbi:ABC transporter ATP-binding protein [Pararhodobacter sp. SW119]|uniref:ABC transporter ATP-binding protein n=1 Tax=Pararhodobacter sp. SW119 TaxID=2780075 RepID=UPI001AE05581|nr:ABC transporter ATP-binding protein [Pararhodobacter sp. SW119]